ncbi:MAG: UPF0175 family protein [Thermodesulfobacteriota bacterium]
MIPITIRISKEILNKIKRFSREKQVGESEYLRRIIEKGLKVEREEEILRAYQNSEIHLSEAARRLNMDIWDFLRLLSERNMALNVSLEDWLNSSSI